MLAEGRTTSRRAPRWTQEKKALQLTHSVVALACPRSSGRILSLQSRQREPVIPSKRETLLSVKALLQRHMLMPMDQPRNRIGVPYFARILTGGWFGGGRAREACLLISVEVAAGSLRKELTGLSVSGCFQ